MIDESAPDTSRQNVIASVCLAVALVTAVNLVIVTIFRNATENRGYEEIGAKWELIDDGPDPVDWLLLGDSSCSQGLDPDVFEAAAGRTALNLCTTGDMVVVGDVWYLEQYLDEVGPPRQGILVTHAYDIWPRTAEELVASSWVVPGSDQWRRHRAVFGATLQERVLGVIGEWFPLYTKPKSSTRLLIDSGRILDAPPLELSPAGFRRTGGPDPRQVEADVAHHLADGPITAFEPSDVNREALDLLAEIAFDAGVPLVLIPSPVVETAWADPEFRLRFSVATEPPRSAARDDPNVLLLREEPWLYPVEEMQNVDHIAEGSSTRHTEAVLDALREAGLLD